MEEAFFATNPEDEFSLIILIVAFFYFAFMQYKIAVRLGHEKNAWWAWIPVLNLVLQIQMARKDMFWFLLCLIPIVNIFVFIGLWLSIARECGKSQLWGLMATVPILNIIAYAYLAYSGEESKPKQAMVISSYRENEHVGY